MVLVLPQQISPLMLLIQLKMRVANLFRVLLGNMHAVPILEEKSVWGTDAPTIIAYMDTQVKDSQLLG